MNPRCISSECLSTTGFSYTLSLINGKYKMTILYTLMEFGVVRFNEMKKYIKTFPLTEKEIDQMIEDITGMAEEAQERNENFETVLGKSVHEFCDDLIYSVGGIRAPGGRKLIRGTSIYFQLLGNCRLFD